MSKDVLIEAAVRNVLHHYAVMMSLKNHRIHLDNVAVVYYVKVRLVCQLDCSSVINKRL